MNVLFISRSHIGLSKGGLQGQILRTAQCLQNRGFEVVFADAWQNQISNVDICHCWSSDPQMVYHVKEAKKQNIPVVISPVFMRFLEPLFKVSLEYHLARLIPGLFTPQMIQSTMFNACDGLIALNMEEKEVLQRVFNLSDEKVHIVPNGIDQKFAKGDPNLFIEKYGVKDFVLQVGYIESRKNALTIIRAMKDLPYHLVLVGGWEMRDNDYVEQCKKEAGSNVTFTGHIDNDDPMLASAYAAAKVFVLPSFNEVMPLVVYEAGQAGCKLVLSNTFPCAELIRDYVRFAHPRRPEQFRTQILDALLEKENSHVREISLSMPTWQDITDQIIEIYSGLIDESHLNGKTLK